MALLEVNLLILILLRGSILISASSGNAVDTAASPLRPIAANILSEVEVARGLLRGTGVATATLEAIIAWFVKVVVLLNEKVRGECGKGWIIGTRKMSKVQVSGKRHGGWKRRGIKNTKGRSDISFAPKSPKRAHSQQ